MAQERKIPQQQKAKPAKKAAWAFPLKRKNWYILAAGVACQLVGFGLMLTAITSDPVKHQQIWDNPLAISVAPIVMVIGLLILIPYGLFWQEKNIEQPPQL